MTRNALGWLVLGVFALGTMLYLCWNPSRIPHGAVRQKITCANNLRQIGLAFRTWAIDHDGQFPFNVSTNAGGSRELCAAGGDGFDLNAALHFKALANGTELIAPRFLICPRDRARKAASTFSQLKLEDLTYRLRAGTNISETSPAEVLLACPIDGNKLLCDGSVVEGRGPFAANLGWHRN